MQKPFCPQHEKELDFNKTLICHKCAITDHSEDMGQHEPICASDAFNDFRVTANALMVRADFHKQQTQEGISKCIANASKLNKQRNDITRHINYSVSQMLKLVQDTRKALEEKLENVCEAKHKQSTSQIDELKTIISDVEEKQNYITTLLKSNEATALQTCQQAIQELQEKIAVLPKIELKDDGKIYFYPTECDVIMKKNILKIGSVSEKPNENIFEIVSENPMTVTSCQRFQVEIVQKYECDVNINDLAVFEDGKISLLKLRVAKIIRYKGKFFVVGYSNKDVTLNVMFCNASIKGSPIKIVVEPVGIIRCIKNVGQSTGAISIRYKQKQYFGEYMVEREKSEYDRGIKDLLISGNGWFLVACNTHKVFKFEMSGAFMSTITLSPTSKVKRICKLKNNNLIFCDWGNSNITIFKQDGRVIKSITTCLATKSTGLATESCLSGIDVDEDLNLVYVADQAANCVKVFNLETNIKVKTIGSKGGLEGQMNGPSDVAVTKNGNVIVADTDNHRLQLFCSDGQFIKVIIYGGNEDGMVINPTRVSVDYDDNIIVACKGKVQLFNNCGKFLRVIHENEKDKTNDFAFSIVSDFPRRLALANVNSITINIINY
ncbi:tripartite motif-containing protein 2-like [Anneissia japonica]|uniref:tripartite motif-containing protein 2-like n=1 Tax=Anneissia japonica TaxID=1529436 RepID=UPI00142598ED|nr:tripartite motif-containing protein 2-like [Anneissia japonica]